MSFPNLSALAVRERALTLFFLLLSVVAGVYAFTTLGRAEDPSFTVRIMVVSALWPGATPEEIEEQVADRLEQRIQEVEDLYRIETVIRPGRVDLQVEFEDYTPSEAVPDLFYEVRKRMWDEAPNLPEGVIGPIVNDDFSDVYFSLLALTAPGLPMADLTREAEAIRDRLQRLDGTRKVLLLGERSERVFVEFDPARLANLGVRPEVIFDAIAAHNQLAPAGFIDREGPRTYLRIDSDLSARGALEAVPVAIGDRLLRLGNLATVHSGYEDPPSYLVRAHGEDAILLGVVMREGENGLDFGAELSAFLERERGRLPLGMTLHTLTNQTDMIRAAVDLFQVKFLVAVAVVMAVSILSIGLRAGLIVGIAIPVTLGLAFLLMKLAGINLDRITLGALIIALGLLVDDAIIAIEMMIVKMEAGWDRVQAATHAWNVTAAPMLFGTLVTVVGFVPIGFARSGVGEYAGNIFWVMAFSLLVSWLVAVTFTPWLGVKLLPDLHSQGHGEDAYQTPLYRCLRGLILACVRHRKSVVAVTVALLALGVVGMNTVVQKQFFPASDRPEALVEIYLPQGSAIGVTDRVVQRLEAVLEDMPEVRSLSSYVGAGAPRFFLSANPEQPNPAFAKIIAIGEDADGRDHILKTLRTHVDAGEFPEARIRLTRLFYGPPVVWPVTFRILGPDPLVLRELARGVSARVDAHPNTTGTHLDWDERVPVVRLKMDSERLRLMGLTPSEVARQVQFQLDGLPIDELRRDVRTVELRARARRDTLPDLEHLEIRNQSGDKLPLIQLGELSVEFEDPVIKRHNRQRVLAVQADVRGAQAPAVQMAIWQQLESFRSQLPLDYHMELGGSIESSAKGEGSIQAMQPVMVILTLILIMLQMRSFSGLFIVVATVPLGLVGAVAAMVLFDQPFGINALLGLIGLSGILMRNTMILTQQVQDNLEAGLEAATAVIEAAVQRARPVVLTALAAVFAFVPLTLDSFWGPLAYVLIGGIAVGTAITLLFVPALYALWFRLQVPER